MAEIKDDLLYCQPILGEKYQGNYQSHKSLQNKEWLTTEGSSELNFLSVNSSLMF